MKACNYSVLLWYRGSWNTFGPYDTISSVIWVHLESSTNRCHSDVRTFWLDYKLDTHFVMPVIHHPFIELHNALLDFFFYEFPLCFLLASLVCSALSAFWVRLLKVCPYLNLYPVGRYRVTHARAWSFQLCNVISFHMKYSNSSVT